MPYCLYVRKSRADAEAEARGEGETLSRHISTLLELAKKRNFPITQIHKEIVSGETIAARPVMQQLLYEVEHGVWDGVLVMEVERLARGDTIDQGIVAQTFKYSNTKIITPVKDYNPNDEFDEEYFEFGLFMSRREYKTINRRLQRGRVASVKEGKYVGSKSPYGYDRIKIEGDKGYTLTPNRQEADIVRLIFHLYTIGEKQEDGTYSRIGVSKIVRKLNDMHIPPRNSVHWSPATIRDILINPVYIGKIRWNWREEKKNMVDGQITVSRPRSSSNDVIITDGKHPPIISIKEFELAQELMSSNPPHPVSRNRTVKNPLSGLVTCARCGKNMVRRPYNNKQADTLMCADTACNNVSSPLYLVESRLLSALKEWLFDYKLKQGNTSDDVTSYIQIKERTLLQLSSEYDKVNRQLDKAHDLLEQGIYTTDQFLDRSRKLSDRLMQLKKEKASLEEEIASDKKREQCRSQIVPKVEKLLDVYDMLPDAKTKNEMLKEVLEKVVYLKTKKCRWEKSPDLFELTIYPKIPKYE